MPTPKSKELGIRNPFIWRAGINFPTWEGVNRQNDPGAIRDAQLYDAINVRINGNEIVCRGGQEKVNPDENASGCVYGMVDVDEGAAMYVGMPGGSTDWFNPDGDPNIETNVLTGALDEQSISAFGDDSKARRRYYRLGGNIVVFGKDANNTGSLFQLVPPPVDVDPAQVTSKTKVTKLFDLAEASSFTVLQELRGDGTFGPVLYIGATSTGIPYRWDGTTLSADAAGSLGSGRQIMTTALGDVFVSGTNYIKKRNGGTWDTVSIPAGITTWEPSCGAEYQTYLVLGGRDSGMGSGPALLITYDGTTSVKHELTTGGTTPRAGVAVSDCVVAEGILYFAWTQTGASSNPAIIGKWDGTTWSDDIVSFTVENNGDAGFLTVMGEDLIISCIRDIDSDANHGTITGVQLSDLSDTVLVDFGAVSDDPSNVHADDVVL